MATKEVGTCQYVFSKGIMAGTKCGERTTRDGGKLCWKHKNRDIDQLIELDEKEVAAKAILKEHRYAKSLILKLNDRAQKLIDLYNSQSYLTPIEQSSLSALKKVIDSAEIKRL